MSKSQTGSGTKDTWEPQAHLPLAAWTSCRQVSELPATKQGWPSFLCRRETSLVRSRLSQLPALCPRC